MLNLLTAFSLGLAHAATCDDILYYGKLIDLVIRTGQPPYGLLSDRTTFAEYAQDLGDPFVSALERIESADAWVNFGAGRALAERQVIAGEVPSGQPRVIAISAHRPADGTYDEFTGRHAYLHGQMIEDVDWSLVPKARLASDRFGPLSYARHFDRALRLEVEALAPGGELFAVLQAGRTSIHEGRRSVTLTEYLHRTRGLVVTHAPHTVPGREHLIRFSVRRTKGSVRPPRLAVKGLKLQLPPLRDYAL